MCDVPHTVHACNIARTSKKLAHGSVGYKLQLSGIQSADLMEEKVMSCRASRIPGNENLVPGIVFGQPCGS